MVKKNYKRQQRINQGMKLLSNSFRVVDNAVRLNTHNTLSHELAKTKKAYQLIYDGWDIVTEAVFHNGSTADIFVPELLQVFEILHSETEQMAKEKLDRYPQELDIFFINSQELIDEVIK